MPEKNRAEEAAAVSEDRQFVVALARGLEVLRCFSPKARSLGTTDIAARTALPQPTVWRLCYTLQKLGYLVPAPNRDKLMLGPAALALGGAALAGQESLDVARPAMQAFADRYRGAVALGRRDQDSIVYLLRCQGDSELLMNFRVGSRIALYKSAIGGAWIATSSGQERRDLMAGVAALDKSEKAWIKSALGEYEVDGFVLHSRPLLHVHTVATAIVLGENDRYVLNCGGPASVLSEDTMRREVGPALVRLAAELRPAFALGRRVS